MWFKLIFLALLAFLIYLFVKFIRFLQKINPPPEPKSQIKQSNLMVKDKVCNTYLPKEDAIEEIVEGRKYYFCSDTCRQKFLKDGKS